MALTNNQTVLDWIDEMAAMTQPEHIVWIDGSDTQLEELRAQVLSGFTLRVRASLVPPGLGLKQVGPEEYEGALSEEAEIPPVVRNIVQAGGDVYAVSAQRPTLEDIYFALTQCGKGEAV